MRQWQDPRGEVREKVLLERPITRICALGRQLATTEQDATVERVESIQLRGR